MQQRGRGNPCRLDDSLPRFAAILLLVDVGDTSNDNGTDGPEELQDLRSRGSESHGYDLTAVSRGVGDLLT